jgi:epoxyqueuosine reductase QueG
MLALRVDGAATWAAISHLQPKWLPHVAGHTGSGQICRRCSTLCPKGAVVGQGLADGEVGTRVVNKRHDAAPVILRGLRGQRKKRA